MAYILPQVLVFQDFSILPQALVEPLRAFVFGPHYDLKRYTEEKEFIGIGQYDPNDDSNYAWPNRPAGGIVDQDSGYTKLFMEDAWLKYYQNNTSDFDVISGKLNELNTTTVGLNLVDDPDYPLNAAFNDRDVRIGDGVRVRDGSDDIWTYVTGFIPNVDPAVISAATEDVDNNGDQVQAESFTDLSTVSGGVTGVADATLYDGRVTGDTSETYIVTVIQASTGGDATTGRLKVESASGRDDVDVAIPAAFGAATAIGARGAECTFSLGTATDFELGMKFQIDVTQAYSKPTTVTSGGTFTGPFDTSYIVTVTVGGDYGTAKVLISTTTGADNSGPVTVSDGVPFSVGNFGATLTLGSGDGLVAGDRFIIPVEAEGPGAVQTLVLAHSLPATMVGASLIVDFYIRKDLEVTENRTGFAPLVNWETSETEFVTKQGMVAYDASWNASGVLLPLDIERGDMFVHYRSLVQDFSGAITDFDDVGALSDFGVVDPDNPFLYGLFHALNNSNGTEVKGMSVSTDDFAGYSEVVSAAVGRNDVYGFVPLTQDRKVQDLVASHVDSMSTPEDGRWRTAWFNSEAQEEEGVYIVIDDNEFDDTPGDPILGTVLDDPATSGTQYTLVTVTDGEFLTKGVRPTDILRTNYTSDGFGNETYEEYVIDRVISEDTIRLVSGPGAAINIPSKLEIWRNLSKDEIAANYGIISGSFGNRRNRHVWPDWISAAGQNVRGFYLCAALAGLRSGVAPHQGLTNVEIAGFDDVSRTTEYFNAFQLSQMAEAGTWVVTQDPDTGQVFSRHQLTTGDSNDLNQAEDSVTTNVDSMSYFLLDLFSPFIGKANVTPDFVSKMRTVLTNALDELKNRQFSPDLGGQLVDYEIVEIRQHEILKARIVATVNLTIPYPFNNFELHLVV